MSQYTEAELRARILSLVPSAAVLDRSVDLDGEDVLDSCKDRVARALYSSVDMPYLLAKQTCRKITEFTDEVATLVATVERCAAAMHVDDSASYTNTSYVAASLGDVLESAPESAQSKAALLASDIRRGGYLLGSLAFGREQAMPALEEALARLEVVVPLLDYATDNVRNLLSRISSAALLQWTLRRQVRALKKAQSSASAASYMPAVDLLIASSLLDKSFLALDFSASKYTGTVTPVPGVANRYVLSDTLPEDRLSILPGDIARKALGDEAVVHSVDGDVLYLADVPGWLASTVSILPCHATAYNDMLPSLLAVSSTAAGAAQGLRTKVSLYAYSNTGLPAFRSVLTALQVHASALASSVTSFAQAKTYMPAALLDLVASLREERLFAVINYLEYCDFVGVSELGYAEMSAVSSAGDLLEQLSQILGDGGGSLQLLDATMAQDDYGNRARP
jgi:hypothetical protein